MITQEEEEALWPVLSVDEQERANRFHFPKHRAAFIAARGILRKLLGRYLHQAPMTIQFSYGQQGKPELHSDISLQFNSSHSQGLALMAFGHQMEIGIDLEKIQADIDILQLANNFFSENEKHTILNLTGEEQTLGFFNCWTRKEAFIKAKGMGLSLPLDQFEVDLLTTSPASLLVTSWDINEAQEWTIFPVHPSPQYVAALAINRRVKEIAQYHF